MCSLKKGVSTQTQKCAEELFDLISLDNDNEEEIIKKLNNYQFNCTDTGSVKFPLKTLINISSKDLGANEHDESMLMWAVWRLKKRVVEKLISLGANVNFKNNEGESLSTYWDLNNNCTEERQILATEIAELLHNNGVNLSKKGFYSWDLLTKSHKYNLLIIKHKLEKLGYNI